MKRLFLSVAPTFALSSSIAGANDNSIVGTWSMQSFGREVVATGERQNEFGEKPVGLISYQPDGRMFAMLVGDNRARPTGTLRKGKAFRDADCILRHIRRGRQQNHP
jgi:hypothetical protein